MESKPPPVPTAGFEDDRESLEEGDDVVLAIEDDANFSRLILRECHRRKLKCLLAPTGESGLALAREHQPRAIVLDIRLPGIDGWAVLEALKNDPGTRHIPVHVVSVEVSRMEALQRGAVGVFTKPLQGGQLDEVFDRLAEMSGRRVKNLLVIEDNSDLRRSIVQLIGNGDVVCEEAGTAVEAEGILHEKSFDCIVLDIGLPDLNGFDLLEKLSQEGVALPPVVIYTGRELTREENERLMQYSSSVIIKGVRSEERLLDEVSLFLHRIVENLPASKRAIINRLWQSDEILEGKKILLVDDDMRNVFALSQVLRERGMEVVKADNGLRAIEALEGDEGIDLVLMDIMMPVMDGYEAIRRIRGIERYRELPIIALTAKAMKEDRDQAIAVGANDYHAKPVDISRLCSMMRIWLHR